MSDTSSNDPAATWVRPPGPLNVWSVVESVKNTGNGAPVKFTIQEIPEDRYDDVIQLMATHFIADEPLCDSLNALDDPVLVNDFCGVWRDLLKQGICVAAFADSPRGEKPDLASCNMLGVELKGHEIKASDLHFESPRSEKIFEVVMEISKRAKVYETYGVDKYMYAFGLCVDRRYRGESLGGHLLKARENIGRRYGIPVTSTAFTSPISQKLAARTGFDVLVSVDYDEIVDADGAPVFPNVKSKNMKIMAKRLY